MKPFAKLFNLPNGAQVLLTREWDETETEFVTNIITDIEGVRATVKLAFEAEDDCDKAFEHYSETDAQEHYEHTAKFLA